MRTSVAAALARNEMLVSLFILIDFYYIILFIQLLFVPLPPQTHKTVTIMARPIKDTPVLTGKDAERFRWHMEHPTPLSEEEKRLSWEAYEEAKRNSPNCSLFK
jgi:hypothetical protein